MATSARIGSARASWSDLTVSVTEAPSRSTPEPMAPPSASTSRAICVAERVAVPLVRRSAVRSATPARAPGSVAPPPVATSAAVTSGRSCRSTVMTRRPLARRVSTGRGSVVASGRAGSGGRTRAGPVAGVTTAMSAGGVSGVSWTLGRTAMVSPAFAEGRALSGR